jgi:hypothetical protein
MVMRNMGEKTEICCTMRNAGSLAMLGTYYKQVESKIKNAVSDIHELALKSAIVETHGLKGAMSLIERVTGNKVDIQPDDDSSVGLLIADKLKESGLHDKINKVHTIYELAVTQIDTSDDPTEIMDVINTFKSCAKEILVSEPNPLHIF